MTSKHCERIGWPTLLGLAGAVGLMMLLALCMTATGTARFMAPMGYDIKVGYAVGITLELAQGCATCRRARAMDATRAVGRWRLAPPGSSVWS